MGRVNLSVLNPVATIQGDLQWYPLAPRTGPLSGKKIGLWWNFKRGGDVALTRASELLRQRYADVEPAWYPEQYPAAPETISLAASECQAVIGSSGD